MILGMIRRGVDRAVAVLAPGGSAKSARADGDLRFFVGSYGASGGGGLYPLSYRPSDDIWTLGRPAARHGNMSFGAYAPRFDHHYLLHEQAAGQVTVGRVRKGGVAWRRLGVVSSGGSDPCHVALDAGQSCLVIANFSSGTAMLHRLDARTGLPGEAMALGAPIRPAANNGRSARSRMHWVGFEPKERHLYSVDLGTDGVAAYPFDAAAGTIGAGVLAYAAPGGSGPRHLAFHPHLGKAFLISEFANTVTVLDREDDGTLRAVQILSTLPEGFSGQSQAAHIALSRSGERLYVSNRGANSLAVYSVDAAGALSLLRHASTLGDWPRFFLLVEEHRRLIVANERSGDLVIFRIDDDGLPHPTGARVSAPGAAYIGRLYA